MEILTTATSVALLQNPTAFVLKLFSFYINLIKMFNYYNIPFNFNHDNLDDTKIMHFVDHMQKKYITHWKHSLCNSQKLEFDNVFNEIYTPSISLDVTRKNTNRKTIVKP